MVADDSACCKATPLPRKSCSRMWGLRATLSIPSPTAAAKTMLRLIDETRGCQMSLSNDEITTRSRRDRLEAFPAGPAAAKNGGAKFSKALRVDLNFGIAADPFRPSSSLADLTLGLAWALHPVSCGDHLPEPHHQPPCSWMMALHMVQSIQEDCDLCRLTLRHVLVMGRQRAVYWPTCLAPSLHDAPKLLPVRGSILARFRVIYTLPALCVVEAHHFGVCCSFRAPSLVRTTFHFERNVLLHRLGEGVVEGLAVVFVWSRMHRWAVLGLAAVAQAESVARDETLISTYTTTCTENGTAVVHTHSVPYTTIVNSNITSSSPLSTASVNTTASGSSPPPTTTSGTSATTSSPTTSRLISETHYTTFKSFCTENGTTVIHTHSAVVTGNTTSTASSGPTNSANGTSTTLTSSFSVAVNATTPTAGPTTLLSETSYTTFTSLCTENGTAVTHTHSAPITANATSNSSPGKSHVLNSTATPPRSFSVSVNATTPNLGPTGASTTSFSATSYTTFTSLCTENGTTVIHTHSAPVTGNATTPVSAGPTTSANVTTSASRSFSISANATSPVGPTGTESTTQPASNTTSYSTTQFTT